MRFKCQATQFLDEHDRPHGAERTPEHPLVAVFQLKSQFEVMNTWLDPLLSASEGHRRDLNKLQNAVQTCLANYYSLLQQLEEAKQQR